MADNGDTRKVNQAAFRDPNAMFVPLEKFRSFTRADRLWVLGGLVFLIILLNLVFGTGNGSTVPVAP